MLTSASQELARRSCRERLWLALGVVVVGMGVGAVRYADLQALEANEAPRLTVQVTAIASNIEQQLQGLRAAPVHQPDGHTTLTLAMALVDPQGRFDGAVAATLDTEYFDTLMASVIYGSDTSTRIVHGDGGLLVVVPPQPLLQGVNAAQPESMFSRHLASGQVVSVMRGSSLATGDARLSALRTLQPPALSMDKPLVLTVSRSIDALQAPWRQETALMALLWLGAASAAGLALWLVQRRRQERELALAAEMARQAADAERLRLALRGGDLALWDLDVPSGQATINERWSTMLGYAPGDPAGGSDAWPRLLHPDDHDRVLDALEAPMHLMEAELHVSASIGISMFPSDDTDLDGLIRHTDMAMYRSKAMGRGVYSFYSHELSAEVAARLALENDLRRALERHEFALFYQPKYHLATGAVTGVEALIRWHSPTRGMVAPDRFISVLEDSGLILPVGAWAIRTACAELAAWDRAGAPRLTLAVNLSARQFRQPFLARFIADALSNAGISPHRLELELTESLLLEDSEGNRNVLAALAEMGVRVAIDDFGTGHSSLSYLKRFDIDTLKIDRSFVCELPHDAEDGAIATAIIAMGHSLHMKVVAEGVETVEQAEFLHGLGCDEIQGYLISRPLPAPQLLAWLAERGTRDGPVYQTGCGSLTAFSMETQRTVETLDGIA